ncbi:MAG TPA: TIR domain-containing protein [Terriglobia bacterium]|nr:TIR domain-containing protein [Terriglobia bacterium]
MARRVFFSFHYDEDIWRVNQIRNMGVTRDWETMPFLDHASWEAVKRKGDAAVKAWIDRQLDGSGVTVVLIGSQTANRKYVKYEIQESHRRGNGLLGIYINGLKNQEGQTSGKGRNPFDDFTAQVDGWFGPTTKRFSEIYPTYDWVWNSGYQNINGWIEEAAKKAGR